MFLLLRRLGCMELRLGGDYINIYMYLYHRRDECSHGYFGGYSGLVLCVLISLRFISFSND